MELTMINDEIFPIEQAKISANDRSIYFGDGVYEAIRYINGRLFAFDRHMARLRHSLEEMDMLDKVDLRLLQQRLDRAIEAAQIPDAVVYFQFSRGQALRSHGYDDTLQPCFLLTIRHCPADVAIAGRAITHPDWRWKRCDIKSLNLLANVLARKAAERAGASEAVLIDENNFVTEATSTSVMMVCGNKLQTAPLTANILPGITRALLLEWAPDVGLEPLEQSFTFKDALTADELFVTGTTTEVMAITLLDNHTIGSGNPGPYTTRLRQLLGDAMAEDVVL